MNGHDQQYLLRRLSAFALAGLLSSCGSTEDVYLGAAASRTSASGGSGGQIGTAGPGLCGAAPCANFHGNRVFIEAGAERGPEAFAAASNATPEQEPARVPSVVYPSHETQLPPNLSGLRYEWLPAGNTLFELSFSGLNTQVLVYTKETSFTPTKEQWAIIAESNRGGAVVMIVRGLSAETTTAVGSRPVTLYFSATPVEDAIYYWSPGAAGVMRAQLFEQTPSEVYPAGAADPSLPALDVEKCVGCFSLSRDGTRLAISYEMAPLRVVSLTDQRQLFPPTAGSGGGAGEDPMKMMDKAPNVSADWSTFSPDGNLLLVAGGGKLTLIDLATGAALPQAQITIPQGQVATHLDWSASGDMVVFTLGTKGGARDVEGGAIARASYANQTFGLPEVIVPNAGGNDNNYHPVVSPDGRFVAYVNATGKSDGAPSANIKLVELSTLKVTALTRLNQRVNERDGVLELGNSMPSFAPAVASGTFWLAFSSFRPVASFPPLEKKQYRIFIAAIEPSLPDPSYPAFWAPFQSLEQSGQRGYWTRRP